jgi:hypothetical protein
MPKYLDLVGSRFSQLLVLRRAPNGKGHATKWLCVCDCGNEIAVHRQGLRRGTARHCGSTKTHVSGRGGAQYRTHGLSSSKTYKMYMAAKERAKHKNIPFTLTLSDMPVIPERCPILGIFLSCNSRFQNRDSSPSLDRIVPKYGYIQGNVQIISHKANAMKHNASTEEIGKLYFYMKSLEELIQEKEVVG